MDKAVKIYQIFLIKNNPNNIKSKAIYKYI